MILKSYKGSSLKGCVVAPPDKSISHRATILATLTSGETYIHNLLKSKDVYATLNWAKTLGAKITLHERYAKIDFNINKTTINNNSNYYMFDMGNSGTSARLLMGVMAGLGGKSLFFGDNSLNKRPMLRVIEPLSLMGATFSACTHPTLHIFDNKGKIKTDLINYLTPVTSVDKQKKLFLPVFIQSNHVKGINYHLQLASAQVKSSILLAGLFSEEEINIYEYIPSRNHTENMLISAGVNLVVKNENNGSKIITLKKGVKKLNPINWEIPGDFSSSAFIIIAALLVPNSQVIIKGVNLNPLRSGLLKVLKKMGANINIKYATHLVCGEDYGDILVKYTPNLLPAKVTSELVPLMIDEFPILGCLVSTIKGKSEFLGIEELRYKESDRILSLEKNLNKLGIITESTRNSLIIYGDPDIANRPLEVVYANLDHRIAMSFLILGLIMNNGLIVKEAATINTSFPNFLDIMQSLSANIICI